MQIEGQTCYTAAEAARRLGISPNTLRRQRTSGRIQGIAIGRDYVYSAEEIRRYQIAVQQPAGARSRAGQPARPPRSRGARGEADRPARAPDPAPGPAEPLPPLLADTLAIIASTPGAPKGVILARLAAHDHRGISINRVERVCMALAQRGLIVRIAEGWGYRAAPEPEPAPYHSVAEFMQAVADNGGQIPGSTCTLEMDV